MSAAAASVARAVITNPRIALGLRNIFLLSHMRANTSLFGHLVGSHPSIEGYYEMHIGYFSWKSLWRQKLRHFAVHRAKPGAIYMFDKLLHDGHHVAPELLLRPTSRTIFMTRRPEQSVKSLVVLYRKHLPQNPEATLQGAVDYYVGRMDSLARSAALPGLRYFYLDAERLIGNTDAVVDALSAWLQLPTTIPTSYATFEQTGRGHAGDHSARLKSGQVSGEKTDYSGIELEPDQLRAIRMAYESCRCRLIERAQVHEVEP